jgi:hypothetical protein
MTLHLHSIKLQVLKRQLEKAVCNNQQALVEFYKSFIQIEQQKYEGN